MIYVTGDLHGVWNRFKTKQMKQLKKGDTLLVCGDFGFVWDGSKKEKRLLKKIGKRKYSVLFVEGTHDNLTLLQQYPETPFCDGMARQISGNLWQLSRGEVFTIEGKKIFAFGGGESEDMDIRVIGESWWKEELPTQEELEKARQNLAKVGNVVDYIITHDCSGKLNQFLRMDMDHLNQLHAFFDEVHQSCTYKKWVFGMHHMDKGIPPLHLAVYKNVVELN